MIYINRLNKQILNKNINFVISDFDRTITKSDSATSWSIIPSSKLVNPNLKIDSSKLFNYYRPIELDNNISFQDKSYNMEKWALDQTKLYNKYSITYDLLYEILDTSNNLVLRDGFNDFLLKLYNKGIKLYIVSAGIYDVIKYVLEKNHLLYDNIEIISNHLVYTNNVISGINGTLIHSCNKDSVDLNIKKKDYGLLFGDQVEDRLLGRNYNTLDIGFLNSNNANFDVVLTEGSSFNNISKILIKE